MRNTLNCRVGVVAVTLWLGGSWAVIGQVIGPPYQPLVGNPTNVTPQTSGPIGGWPYLPMQPAMTDSLRPAVAGDATLDPFSQRAISPRPTDHFARLLSANLPSPYVAQTDGGLGPTAASNPWTVGESLKFAVDVTPIPEPCALSWALMGGAIFGISRRRRRSRKPGAGDLCGRRASLIS